MAKSMTVGKRENEKKRLAKRDCFSFSFGDEQ